MSDLYKIGILAGMGPRSTAPFLEWVLDECESQYGAKFDEEFPHLLVYSLPTPFHPKKPLEHDKMLAALKSGIDVLTTAKCDLIAVPCNVVHAYYEQMCDMTPIPILNIIKETVDSLDPDVRKIGLLATRGTIDSGLYQNQVLHKGKEIYWNEDLQEKVDDLIYQVKTIGVCDELLDSWRKIELMMAKAGVTEVVSACTDLFFCAQNSELKIYDSSKTLAARLVKRYVEQGMKGGKQ